MTIIVPGKPKPPIVIEATTTPPVEVVVGRPGPRGPQGERGAGLTDGDKGDISVSDSGAVLTIDAGAVTLSKMADLATSTILGRATAGAGVPEALTALQVRTLLNVADGATANATDAALRDRATHTGTQLAATISDFASAVAATAAVTANTAKVTNATHTGDVTGATALTIANNAVSNAKMADMATATIKGRTTAGTGDPEDLTATQATALLNTFTTGLKGLAPASGGGTTNFLRADGTWAAPPGGGGGVSDADYGDITVSGTGTVWTIDNNAVTFAKMQDIGTGTLIGRFNAGTGDPETMTYGGGLEVNTGILRVAAFTGDVAKSAGGTATTISTNAVDNTKLADMAANTIKANATGSSTDPADLAVGTNTVVGRVAGNIVAAQIVTAQIADNAVDNAKAADMATATIKGRATAGTGNPEDLTGTQATALLDTFTSGAKGLAPASGGGTANFLRADGTWAAPAGGAGTNLSYTAATRVIASDTGTDATLPLVTSGDAGLAPASGGGTTNFLRADGTWAAPSGGGGGSPGGSSGEVQWNNGGAFAGAADVEIEGGQLRLPAIATPTTPAAGGMKLFGRSVAGRVMPCFVGPSGLDSRLQPILSNNSLFYVSPSSGTAAPTVIGGTLSTSVTMSLQQTFGSTNRWLSTSRKRFQTTTTAGVATGMRTAYRQWFRGSAAGFGGFYFQCQFGQNVNLNGGQFFVGLVDNTNALSADPSVTFALNMCGVGYDAADPSTGNWQFFRNDGAGSPVKVDLGATNGARTTDQGLDLTMFLAPGGSELFVRIVNLNTDAVVLDTSYTTDIPAVNTGMCFHAECRNGAVASTANVEVAKVYIETDY